MSDPIKHECGVCLVRPKQQPAYYLERYGTPFWALNKLYLLMEKQRNRGQDGAGLGTLKIDVAPGRQYFKRIREAGGGSLDRLWQSVNGEVARIPSALRTPDQLAELDRLCPWLGDVLIGHLRYGTHSANGLEACHPFMRHSNWKTRCLMLAGNFNLTNTPKIFDLLVQLGQHPIGEADTSTVLEKIGHFLDEANEYLVHRFKGEGLQGAELSRAIADELDVARVLRRAAKSWDGGYHMVGAIGHGAAFCFRDPNGIRPAYWFENDEVVACASERVALVTCFDIGLDDVKSVSPGHALIIDRDAAVRHVEILAPRQEAHCSFERIYFSRGNDVNIYRERKALGRELVPALLKAVDHDIENTVISYIPNTAESAFFGLADGLESYLAEWKEDAILREEEAGDLTRERLRQILSVRPRLEKAALKDAKLRTFISDESGRGDLVSLAYDITYGVLRPGVDNLCVIDDSIVRGTTLRQSILAILARLQPKSIVVLSSAPQIRYPDCYGIDMSELGKFIAFEAAVSLLREKGQESILDEVYELCRGAVAAGDEINHVKRVYDPFSDQQISDRIAQLVYPRNAAWDGEVRVVYQTVEGLRWAIPRHTGDWYFTGDYPTRGGYQVVNRAFINFIEQRTGRAY